MIFSVRDSDMIEGGSKIGEHTVIFYHNQLYMADSGGIFAESFSTYYAYDDLAFSMNIFIAGNVKLRIMLASEVNEDDIIGQKSLAFMNVDLENAFKILKELPSLDLEIVLYDRNVDLLIRTSTQGVLAKMEIIENQLHIYHDTEEIIVPFAQIKSIVETTANKYILQTTLESYEVIYPDKNMTFQNAEVNICDQLLEIKKAESDLFKNKDMLLNMETIEGNGYYGYILANVLQLYVVGQTFPQYQFSWETLEVYLGKQALVLTDGVETFVFRNEIARKFCTVTRIIPKKLMELTGVNHWTKKDNEIQLDDLYAWYSDEKFVLYNPSFKKIIYKCGQFEIKISDKNSCCLVMSTGILKVEQPVESLNLIETPRIIFSVEGFPYYFFVENQEIIVSIPGAAIYHGNHHDFYNLSAQTVGDELRIILSPERDILLPIDDYKKMFKDIVYNEKLPALPQLHVEKLLVSRARNISDLLLFEFFGQWQVIVDYVDKKMNKDTFSDEEMTQYGLFIYHAVFQQRKRMEEISNRFPQFMEALTNEIMTDLKMTHVHQKQQKEMFQVTAQVKSQFQEVENLLSQITSIHFNHDEYQRRLKEAQSASLKKTVVAGVGVTLLTGGLAFILPLMTLANHWGNRRAKEVADEIQREKEHKKNEFYFHKAIELIRHMNEHTIHYYIQQMNQLTYKNLRAEAEILAENKEEHVKLKLFQQSLNVYAKVALPIDFDQQLKPSEIVEDLLSVDNLPDEKIKLHFIE